MIVRVLADWLVPIACPAIRGGWIDVDADRGVIVGLGEPGAAPGPAPDRVLDLGQAVVMPGLVNAHTHLELSHLATAAPPAADFVSWVRSMLASRFSNPAPPDRVHAAIVTAIDAMQRSGTAAVGDIGNTDASVPPLLASLLAGIHFREALGLRGRDASRVAAETRVAVRRTREALDDAPRLAASLAPHAPYSTSADLLRELARGDAPDCRVSSVHLAESQEELVFLATGGGPLRELAEQRGAWDGSWVAPGVRPLAYLEQLGALHADLLVVHGTQLQPAELQRLAASGATLVLCARSNRWVGAGVPPVAEAFAAGGGVAIGTDSLASVDDLNLFAELAHLRALAPSVPAAALLRAATLGGARALGCSALGILAPGASSRAVVRRPPAGVGDVEQWLVGEAADTADLLWLDQLATAAASRPSEHPVSAPRPA